MNLRSAQGLVLVARPVMNQAMLAVDSKKPGVIAAMGRRNIFNIKEGIIASGVYDL